jgi:hypothetical protein
MVKHQRRSHQRGIHSSELDDCTSESGSEDSPSTPKSSVMGWPVGMMPGHHHLHRAQSFADFGGYAMQQQQHQQHQHQQPYAHRHSLSSSGAHEYHGLPQGAMHPHEQAQQQQHPMLQRSATLPQHNYFVTEQNNPGVATMNTNPHAAAAATMHLPYHPQIPRQQQQQPERLPLEIPAYNAHAQAPQMGGSIQSSPSSFSAASGRSPTAPQEPFYTHAPAPPPAHAAAYVLHTTSPVEQHTPPQMVAGFPHAHQHPHSHPHAQGPPQHQPVPQQHHHQQTTPQPPSHQEAPYQASQPQSQPPSEDHWYPYQPPVEVATISQMPAYAYALSTADAWGLKSEFEDPTTMLPSARIENM